MAAESQTPEVNDNPHNLEEDPEEQMGAVIPDPWADSTQLDWPNNEADEEEDES